MTSPNLALSFYQVVEQWGNEICLFFRESEQYSFVQINEFSNKLARHFLKFGIKPQEVICIAGEKCLYSYSAILACLKLGVIYSIFDPDSPAKRLKKIFNTCAPKIIFYPQGFQIEHMLVLGFCKPICWDESLDATIQNLSPTNLDESMKVMGNYAAYIMFTSGSTGFPKGAVMTHSNLLGLIAWSINTYGFGPGEILTNLNPLFFDNAVFDIYSSFFSGATLVPFSKQEATDPKKLIEKIAECRCTSWFSVPSLLIFLQTMKVFNSSNMSCMRRIIFGGEGYPKVKLKVLFDLYNNRIEFHNVYGPTECTCICATYPVSHTDFAEMSGFLPLGNLIENFNYLILDDEGRTVPPGTAGELCLLGSGVGKGYYNDSERTRLSFVQNPQNNSAVEVLYMTGDLVMLNPVDNKIYISGRKDNQIKHMGYRIELEEVENAICGLKDIQQVAVVHTIINGISQLIAFISSTVNLEENSIRKQLQEIIPTYMVPTRYHFLDNLPKNANGKIDRKRIKEVLCNTI